MFDPTPVAAGSEFQINTTTTSNQESPAVTDLADGGFVVTWMSLNQDGSFYGIYGQRYAADGTAAGSEFPINTTTADFQQSSSVTALADGGFVVTWMSRNQDGDSWGVYGQRYDESGTSAGSEFQINTTTVSVQMYPSVTALTDGGFVVTWVALDQDGSGFGIYGQRYAADGTAAGSEFPINTTTTDDQTYPSVTALADGGFVVTWMSDSQDGDGYGIYGQRYAAAGTAAGSESLINTSTTDDQTYPAVTGLADGGFVVTWMSGSQDGDGDGIYGQRYAAAGTAAGSEFPINTSTTDDQTYPSVTALADGGFVVTWMSHNQDGDGYGIYGQRYAADGTAAGSEFLVNTTTVDNQEQPSVTDLADGGFVVTWMSRNQDGDSWGVFGQRFDAPTNAAPTGIAVDNLTIAENAAADTLVGTASATDPDDGDTVTWSLRDDAGGRFAVDATTGAITATAPLDHEAADSYQITVRATDGGDLFYDEIVTVTVEDVDEAPTGIAVDNLTIAENAAADTLVGTASATDPDDGDTVTWSLQDDAGGRFAVDATTGAITATAPLDHEAADSYQITVRATDGDDLFHAEIVTVTVEDVEIDDTVVYGAGDDSILFPGKTLYDGVDGSDGEDRLVVAAASVTLAPVGGRLYFELDGIGVAAADGSADRDLTARNVEAVEIHAGGATFAGDFAATGLAPISLTYVGDDGANELDATAVAASGGVVAFGHAGADILRGGAGADVLNGGDGGDLLIGGAGIDTADYSGSTGRVTVSLMSGNGWYGHAAGDKLSSVENAVGSAFDDSLKGTTGANRLDGGDGDDRLDGQAGADVLAGGAGADRLIGGSGLDTADYSASTGSVTASLASGAGSYGHASGDTLDSIENVIGSAFDDSLEGTTGANRLEGGAGGDTLDGQGGDDILAGGAGPDRLLGGAGVDTADYSGATGRVTVSLMSGNGWYGHASGDTLAGVENAVGSAFSDSLKGSTSANRLDGGAGDDALDGQNGNDILIGGAGNDRLTGGGGNDRFVFGNGVGDDTITDFVAGAGTPDAIDLSANSLLNGFAAVLTHSSQSGLDTLINLGGGDLLTLAGVTRTSLHQDDFVF